MKYAFPIALNSLKQKNGTEFRNEYYVSHLVRGHWKSYFLYQSIVDK